jgi:hypothetical protein
VSWHPWIAGLAVLNSAGCAVYRYLDAYANVGLQTREQFESFVARCCGRLAPSGRAATTASRASGRPSWKSWTLDDGGDLLWLETTSAYAGGTQDKALCGLAGARVGRVDRWRSESASR